jgi:alpha-glucosidase (family GH31 glycosyl hydrolase)
MKRKIWLIILAALLAIGVAEWCVPAALKAYRQRPVSVSLEASLPTETYALENFSLHWDREAQELRVTNSGKPDHNLWSSLPGRGFIAAARGEEMVDEVRGSFFIEDRRVTICSEQTLDSISQKESKVIVAGTLNCDGGTEPIAYSMIFEEEGRRRLHFTITLENESFNRIFLTYSSEPDEHFYGFGEQFTYFDMKGRRLPIFVMEQGIGRGVQPITIAANLQTSAGGDWSTSYAGVPFYITSKLRSVFLESYEYSVFDLRQSDRVQVQLFSNMMVGEILYGESPSDLIGAYTGYTGKMQPLPDWILSGAVIGMQGGTDAARLTYGRLRAYRTPIAAFWLQDWVGQRTTSFGKQLWWNWELDQEQYPGWDQMVADFEDQGVYVMVYASPFLADVSDKPGVERNLFAEAAEQGYLVKNTDGDLYLIQNTDFSAGMVDLTHPDAWKWYKGVLRDQVIASGAKGWLADFGEALPYDAVLYEGDAASVHNQYPELWAQLNREVIDEADNELVSFHRSGYMRSPRYASLFWEGDQLVTWDQYDGIKSAVIGLLSSGMSGYAFNHSDIGGYTTINNPLWNYHRSEELLMRWMELSAFTTIYRTHEGNLPDKNAQITSSDETLTQFSRMAHVYKAWEFYRRQLVKEANQTGLPVVRHLFIHYWDDPNVYELSYQQFMVGSEMLVVPVLYPGKDKVRVYLPAGEWVHVWSGKTYGSTNKGIWVTLPAPMGEPVVLYHSGSAVGEQFAANLRETGLLDD